MGSVYWSYQARMPFLFLFCVLMVVVVVVAAQIFCFGRHMPLAHSKILVEMSVIESAPWAMGALRGPKPRHSVFLLPLATETPAKDRACDRNQPVSFFPRSYIYWGRKSFSASGMFSKVPRYSHPPFQAGGIMGSQGEWE